MSGKGGTGKTFVSTNLACTAGQSVYVDCDVEAPNGNLFFKTETICEEVITKSIPVCNNDLCSGCKKCVEFCRFNALAYAKDHLMIFEDICHSCGGCNLLCPNGAISSIQKPVGKIQSGQFEGISVHTGILNIGEASGTKIINALADKVKSENSRHVVIDCPPGSACIVMESIKDADFCVLVAEPTLFGQHNLAMVHDLVKVFNKPYGVVLNKCIDGTNPSRDYCINNNVPILGQIDFDKDLGLMISDGKIAVKESTQYNYLFCSIFNKIVKESK